MRLPILGPLDERFFLHRLRSTSIGGLAAILVTGALFFYHLIHERVIQWELFAIIATAAVVKLSVLTWYRLND
jgi:hypothetical protein